MKHSKKLAEAVVNLRNNIYFQELMAMMEAERDSLMQEAIHTGSEHKCGAASSVDLLIKTIKDAPEKHLKLNK